MDQISRAYTDIESKGMSFSLLTTGLVVLLLGSVVIFGWLTENTSLIQVNPAFVPMQFNTALGFLLSGLGLTFIGNRSTPIVLERVARFIGLLLLLLGCLTLSQYIWGVDLQIDQFLMKHYIDLNTSHPGRMAPNTALCFAVTGAALLLARSTPSSFMQACQGNLGALIGSLGLMAFIGYLSNIETAYGWGALTKMAVHTSLGFIVIGFGFVFNAFNVHRSENEVGLPGWTLLAILIFGFSLTLGLWQALSAYDNSLANTFGDSAHTLADEIMLFFGVVLTITLFWVVRERFQTSSVDSQRIIGRNVPWIIVVLGTLLSASLYQLLSGNFDANVKGRFEAAVEARTKTVQQGFSSYLESLYHIRSAFYASDSLSPEEFAIYAERDLAKFPGIISLQWAPHIPSAKREIFETLAAQMYEGIDDVRIQEYNDQMRVVEAAEREFYFPVMYMTPFETNKEIIGFDTATNPPGIESLWAAASNDMPYASAKLNLVQVDTSDYGVILSLPVYQDRSVSDITPNKRVFLVRGLVIAVFDVNSMIESILVNNTKAFGLDIWFHEEPSNHDDGFLYHHKSRVPDDNQRVADLEMSKHIYLADRKWTMTMRAVNGQFYPKGSMTTVFIPLLSFLLFIGLAVYLYKSSKRVQEKNQLLEKVATRERQLDVLVNTVPGTVFTTSVDGSNTLLFVNKEVEALTGYHPDDFLHKKTVTFSQIMHEDDIERVRDLIDQAISNQTHYSTEYRLKKKEGSIRWVFERGQALYDEHGQPKVLHGTILDITYRKDSEEQFKGLLESAPDSMVIVDEQGLIVLINEQAELLFNYQREELIGQPLEILLPDRARSVHPQYRDNYFSHPKVRQMGSGTELTARRKDGMEIPVEISLSPMKQGDGLLVSAAIRDITARKALEHEIIQAKEKAEEATQAKSDFLANMSHEIRTPMNSIIGMSHLVLQTDMAPKQRNYVEKVYRSAESLLGIINDILDFSKIEADKLDLEKTPFNLSSVFENLSNLVGLKAEEKGIELLFDIPSDVPMHLIGDPLRLGQILTNLGNNAVKFTEQGEVVISLSVAELSGSSVTLKFSVKDTGIGMTDEQLSKLFQSFSQADTSTTRKYGGTGLGLAICKKLTQLMGGDIQARSVLDQGSEFEFTANFIISEHAVVERKDTDQLNNLNVLVVDDNATSRTILCSILASMGFLVDSAKDGYDAIRLIKNMHDTTPYQLVVMDWKMPGMDGIETSRKIQSDQDITHIPTCIMVTAYGRDEAIKEASNVEMEVFLTKPVTPSSLYDGILRAVGKEHLIPKGSHKHHETSEQAIQKLSGANILLVEDNELNQELALELLTLNGLTVEVANHGQEALTLLTEKTFDGVLMDCQMPVMDGYTATRAIRENPDHEHLPVIAMTANAMAGDKEKALASGMNDHISKPIDPVKMFEIMAQWITPTNPQVASTSIPMSAKQEILLPDIAQIDVKDALRRCQNNRALFKTLLMSFAKKHSSFKAGMSAAKQDADPTALVRYVHTFKGNVANLALKELQRLSTDLEHKLRNNESIDEQQALVDEIEVQLELVIRQIEAYRAQESDSGNDELGSSGWLTMEELEGRFHDLLEAVSYSDVSALELLKNLMLFANAKPYKQVFHNIHDLLEAFDFDSAEPLIKDLKSNLISDL